MARRYKIDTGNNGRAVTLKRVAGENIEDDNVSTNLQVNVKTPKSTRTENKVPPAPKPATRKRRLSRPELTSSGISPLRIVFDSEKDSKEDGSSDKGSKSSEGEDVIVAVSSSFDGDGRSIRRRVAFSQSDRLRIAQEQLEQKIRSDSPPVSPIRRKHRSASIPVLRSPPKVALRQAISKFEDGLQLLKAIYGSMDFSESESDSESEIFVD